MGFGVVVPVVGGGVAERERERERQWGKVTEIRDKGKREIILYYFLLYNLYYFNVLYCKIKVRMLEYCKMILYKLIK